MELLKGEKSFTIALKGCELISHCPESPFIYAGYGKASYDMKLGNFHIEQEVESRVPLNEFEIKNIGNYFDITFSGSGQYTVKVIFKEDEGRLTLMFEADEDIINRIWLRIPASNDEHIYGCGEQYSYLDLRGRKFPIWVSEQGVGRNKNTYATFMADSTEGAGGDYYTTYFPQGTFISSRKYFFHIEDSSYMEFNFKNSSYHESEIWGIPKRVIVSKQDTYIKILEDLTSLLGRQPKLPDWVFSGVWIGVQGGTDIMLNKLDNALSKGLKVSAVWAQDWEGKRVTYFGKRLMWNWQWDKNLYPRLDEEIERLNSMGIRFLGYINPYLAVEGSLFKEALEKGFLVRDKEGGAYLIDAGAFMTGMVDLTNPGAFEWYKGIIRKNMIGLGLSGWMADFGEYLPVDAILHNGLSGEKMHNLWPVIWARCNREAVEEKSRLYDIVYFMRSGYAGTQKYSTLMWAGDQNVDWSTDDGLPSVVTGALSLGLSGFGLYHSDIGGYTTLFGMKRTAELFKRWAEMAAFMPVMRTHEGNRPDDNWQFDSDEETLLHFARMSRIYCGLAPYMKVLVKENAKKGIPVIRPLFLHYEDDEETFSIQDEYMLGSDMLAAPVLEEGKNVRRVYLPRDEWVHLWSGKHYGGGKFEVESPLGYPPVFYRVSSSWSELFEGVGRL